LPLNREAREACHFGSMYVTHTDTSLAAYGLLM
jgi:hypothetical protein